MTRSSLKNDFVCKSALHAAPDFDSDCGFYTEQKLWPYINCLEYAIGHRGKNFDAALSKVKPWGVSLNVDNLAAILSSCGLLPVQNNDLSCLPRNYYPIAGFVAPWGYGERGEFVDYHLYKLNSNRTWSHKNCSRPYPARNTDESGQVIYNPLVANRCIITAHNYSMFVGFYAVPKEGVSVLRDHSINHEAIRNHIKYSANILKR